MTKKYSLSGTAKRKTVLYGIATPNPVAFTLEFLLG
jgi:hypothetical protein